MLTDKTQQLNSQIYDLKSQLATLQGKLKTANTKINKESRARRDVECLRGVEEICALQLRLLNCYASLSALADD